MSSGGLNRRASTGDLNGGACEASIGVLVGIK